MKKITSIKLIPFLDSQLIKVNLKILHNILTNNFGRQLILQLILITHRFLKIIKLTMEGVEAALHQVI